MAWDDNDPSPGWGKGRTDDGAKADDHIPDGRFWLFIAGSPVDVVALAEFMSLSTLYLSSVWKLNPPG